MPRGRQGIWSFYGVTFNEEEVRWLKEQGFHYSTIKGRIARGMTKKRCLLQEKGKNGRVYK